MKLFKKQDRDGEYDSIGWDGRSWVGMVEEEKNKWHTKTLKGFSKGEIKSMEVMGHCEWQISW